MPSIIKTTDIDSSNSMFNNTLINNPVKQKYNNIFKSNILYMYDIKQNNQRVIYLSPF